MALPICCRDLAVRRLNVIHGMASVAESVF